MANTNGSDAEAHTATGPVDGLPEDHERRQGPGHAPVGRAGVGGLAVYLTLFTALTLYALVQLWPYPTPAMIAAGEGAAQEDARSAGGAPGAPDAPAAQVPDTITLAVPDQDPADTAAAPDSVRVPAAGTASEVLVPVWLACVPDLIPYYMTLEDDDKQNVPKCVRLLWRNFAIWDEQRLLLIVLLAGALGSLVHGIRSMTMYVGNRELRWSWVAYYALLPFGGATTALVFYLVIRGGFFSPSSDFSQTSPFGFAAFAAIVGLFSQNAILKLQKIAETIFEPNEQQADSLGGAAGTPSIARLTRTATVEGGREDRVEIAGSGFAQDAQLEVNDKPRAGEWRSAALMHLTLNDADLAVLENGGTLSIVVVNPGDARSGAVELGE